MKKTLRVEGAKTTRKRINFGVPRIVFAIFFGIS